MTGGGLDDPGDALSVKRGEVYPAGAGTAADLYQRPAERMPTGELVGAIGEHKTERTEGGVRERNGQVLGRPVGPVHVLQKQQDR